MGLIQTLVRERARAERAAVADVRFTRRDIRAATGWSDNQLKVHCQRLTDMEYLLIHGGSRGHSLRYELLWDGDAQGDERHLCGLIDLGDLGEPDGDAPGLPDPSLRPAQAGVPGTQLRPSWPQVGGVLRSPENPPAPASIGLQPDSLPQAAPVLNKEKSVSSLAAVIAVAH